MCVVDANGGLELPDFVQATLRRRSDSNRIMFGPHESDPCMVGYDPGYDSKLLQEQERLRASGQDNGKLDARARRVFGLVADRRWEKDGHVDLPSRMRRKCGVVDRALFVGTAGMFEIWDPQHALDSGDEALIEIAEWRLEDDIPPAEQDI